MLVVLLDASKIKDDGSFHSAFAELIGFPAFYGGNMDAWIDCMSHLTEEDPMSSLTVRAGEQLTIEVLEFEDFSRRKPSLSETFLRCTAFVNQRYAARGEATRVALVLL